MSLRSAVAALPPTVRWALLPLALATVVYFPITENFFYADDFYHFYRIRNGSLLHYLVIPQGAHLLLTTNSILFLWHALFGPQPEPYFWKVLLTHLLNVGLFFALLHRVTHSVYLAAFGATLWGTAPSLEGSLGWYSVFGHVMLAAAILWLLYDLAGIERGAAVGLTSYARWVVLLFVAATTFGIGIGVVIVFPLVAWLVLPRSRTRGVIVLVFLAVAASTPLLYVAMHRAFSPARMEFSSLIGPLLSYPRVIAGFFLNLTGFGIARATLGTLWVTPEYPGALAYTIVALFAIGVVLTLALGQPRTRRYLLAYLLVALAGYAMIVTGRALSYQSHPGTVRADRYQYLPPLALILCVCIVLGELGSRLALTARVKAALVVASSALLIGTHWLYGTSIDHHDVARRETGWVIEGVQENAALRPPGADVYIPNRVFVSMGPLFVKVPTLFPRWAGAFVVVFPSNVVDGRRIFFVEKDPRVIKSHAHGRRSAGLLVPPRVPTPTGPKQTRWNQKP